MKTLVFGLYVATVLVFSAFARAEMAMPYANLEKLQVPVEITSIESNQQDMLQLDIVGILPDPCYGEPEGVLLQDQWDPTILRLIVTSPPATDRMCPSVRVKVESSLSLPTAAQQSQLQLEQKAIYTIKVEGYEFTTTALGSDLMKVPGFIVQ